MIESKMISIIFLFTYGKAYEVNWYFVLLLDNQFIYAVNKKKKKKEKLKVKE